MTIGRLNGPLILFAAAGLGALGGCAHPIDQFSPAAKPPVPSTLAIGGGTEQVVSQTVTAGRSGRLRELRVPLACTDGILVVEIRDVNAAGQPGTMVLTSKRFAASALPGPVTNDYRDLFMLDASPRLRLAAGQRFAISFANPTGSCGVWPGPEGDPYPAGQGWADPNDTPIVPISLGTGRDDIPFVTVLQR